MEYYVLFFFPYTVISWTFFLNLQVLCKYKWKCQPSNQRLLGNIWVLVFLFFYHKKCRSRRWQCSNICQALLSMYEMIGVKSFHNIQWEKRPKTMQVRIPSAVVLFEWVLGQLLINSCFCQHSLLLEKKKKSFQT